MKACVIIPRNLLISTWPKRTDIAVRSTSSRYNPVPLARQMILSIRKCTPTFTTKKGLNHNYQYSVYHAFLSSTIDFLFLYNIRFPMQGASIRIYLRNPIYSPYYIRDTAGQHMLKASNLADNNQIFSQATHSFRLRRLIIRFYRLLWKYTQRIRMHGILLKRFIITNPVF